MNKPATPVVIIGCGHVGTLLAQQLGKQNTPIQALVRSTQSQQKLLGFGLDKVQAVDMGQNFPIELDTKDSELYYFAPPPSEGTKDLFMAHFLNALEISDGRPKRIVYISTTGVYGDCEGRWIDENEPVKPAVDRARRRLDAEQQLSHWTQQHNTELVILRVSGIYGPGKLPLARLQKGLPVIKESESPYTNRIHADDLVTIAIAAMQKGGNGEIYNVSDDQPGTMTDYFKQVAIKAKLMLPKEISLEDGKSQLSAGLMSYMQESRRLNNDKVKNELEVNLKYPTLKEGLNNCF